MRSMDLWLTCKTFYHCGFTFDHITVVTIRLLCTLHTTGHDTNSALSSDKFTIVPFYGRSYRCLYVHLLVAESVRSLAATPGFEYRLRRYFRLCVPSFMSFGVRVASKLFLCVSECLALFRQFMFVGDYFRFIECLCSVTCQMARLIYKRKVRKGHVCRVLEVHSNASSLRRYAYSPIYSLPFSAL